MLALVCCFMMLVASTAGSGLAVPGALDLAVPSSSSGVSAPPARDLTGAWSTWDPASTVAYTTNFVQKGNVLLSPNRIATAQPPFVINVTLYNGYGSGEGALVRISDQAFCLWTTVVVDVVDDGFMKMTWFPQHAGGVCTLPFSGKTMKYTRLY